MIAAPAPETPRAGDVIFIGGTGDWADLGASLSKTDKRYGHVGFVVEDSEGLAVIHASGAPGTGGVVTRTRYPDFIRVSKRVGLYRIDQDSLVADILDGAVGAEHDRVPFDDDFSLDTDDTVYCSEFVWRVLSTALDEDAVPDKTQWFGTPIISLEDLQRAPHLRAVFHLEKKANE